MFGPSKERLFEIQEDSTSSIGTDVRELSEGEVEAPGKVNPPEREEEQILEDEPEVERPEEIEEEEEIEEGEEIPEVKDLHPFERPSIKQITEEFPELFKKFPSLKDMYFRESEYSRLYPTIDDAKEASENSEAFTVLREDIFTKDGSEFITAMKDVNEKGLERFSSNILGSLIKVHPPSFWRAANPLVEDIAKNMFIKGTKEKDESMQNAARYLSEYFFGNTEVAEGKKTTIIKEEPSEVSKEREEFEREKDTTFRGIVSTGIKGNLIPLIEGKDPKSGKSRLDPDDILSPFIKSTIIDRIINEIGTQLVSDKDHIRFMDSLWSKARRNGRTDEDKARISSAYLARAKSLIPSLRSKYVSEALGRKVKSADQRREKVSTLESRRDGGAQGKGSGSKPQNYHPKSINYSKTSDEDLLNDNITYK